jgi:hypothetical protein
MRDNRQNNDFDIEQLETNWKKSWGFYQTWHRLSLCAAVVGILLTATLCIAVILELADPTLATVLPSAILNVAFGLSFLQMKSARRQVEIIQQEVFQRRRIETACRAAHQIKDAQKRDEVMAEIARKMPISETRIAKQTKLPLKG